MGKRRAPKLIDSFSTKTSNFTINDWLKVKNPCEFTKPDMGRGTCKSKEHPNAKDKALAGRGYLPCCVEMCPKIGFCEKCRKRCEPRSSLNSSKKLCPVCALTEICES